MADRPHYAIMRIGKIHNYKVLEAVDGHNTRKIPAGTVQGAPAPIDYVNMSGTLCQRAQEVLHDKGAVWEKGKILAVEFLVTASPEWWANASFEQKTEWLKVQWKYATDKFGEGLISFTPHTDESTPHVQFVGLPLYSAIEKTKGRKPSTPEGISRRAKEEAEAAKVWRLSFHEMFGGHSDRLADLQTEYHGYVAHLGLERGDDTRGLNIRHTTLKEGKRKLQKEERELFRRQRELDAEAARLDEKRQALEFYDQQLAKGFGKLEDAKQEFHKAQLAHFAQTEEVRIREEAFTDREAELALRMAAQEASALNLENRIAEVEKREAVAATQEAEAAQRTAQIEKREQELAGIAAQQEAESERLDTENQAARTRDAQLDQKETSIAGRERDLQTTTAQIKVFGRVLVGKLAATWDAGVGKPEIDTSLLAEEERSAMAAQLPVWLTIAMRHAIRIREQRSAIAKRVRRMRQLLASCIANAKAKEQIANDMTSEAVHRKAAADKRLHEAIAAENSARTVTAELSQTQAALVTANKDLERVQTRVSVAENDEALTLSRTKSAEAGLATIESARAQAETALTQIRTDLQSEQATLSDIEAQRTSLKQERDVIETEVVQLRGEKSAIEAQNENLRKEREALTSEREAHDLVAKLLHPDISSKGYARIRDETLEVFVSSIPVGISRPLSLRGAPDWIRVFYSERQKAMDANLALAVAARQLTDRYSELEQLYPDKAPELSKAREKDTTKANSALAVWAALNQQGRGA